MVYGGMRNFLYKNGFYKHVCNVIRFGGNKKNIEIMSMGMTYRTH